MPKNTAFMHNNIHQLMKCILSFNYLNIIHIGFDHIQMLGSGLPQRHSSLWQGTNTVASPVASHGETPTMSSPKDHKRSTPTITTMFTGHGGALIVASLGDHRCSTLNYYSHVYNL